MVDHMIKFPPPLDWFQKKLWRIRWIEWNIIVIIDFISDFANNDATAIILVPIVALILTFAIKYIWQFITLPLKILASFTGFGLVYSFIDLMEATGRIINDINNHIIAKFCEEKPEFDPELSTEHLAGK